MTLLRRSVYSRTHLLVVGLVINNLVNDTRVHAKLALADKSDIEEETMKLS